MNSTIKIFVRDPLGASEHGPYGGRYNINGVSDTGPVKCELCGTVHPAVSNRIYTLGSINIGDQQLAFVEECCGRILDGLLRKAGGIFAEAFLAAYVKNPDDPRFAAFEAQLREILKESKIALLLTGAAY